MIRLSSIIKTFEHELRAQYGDQLLPSHYKALSAMKHCRNSQGPSMLVGCSECHHRRLIPHSCGHRSCPNCQAHESQQWIDRQSRKRLPADYYLLTFTLPAAFRSLAWHHQRIVYALISQCAWATVQQFSLNDKQLQGTTGATTVLHTHSRRLDYHPHIHMVIPAAAVNLSSRRYRAKRCQSNRRYLFSHRALAKVFRAKLLDALSRSGIALPEKYPQRWVVDCKAVGSGEKAIAYLGRYLYRGVIAQKDIVSCENGQVTYRFQNSKTKCTEYRTVPGAKFLWMIIRHVLPRGFRRARDYGFLHSNSKRLIQLIQYLLNLVVETDKPFYRKRPKPVCQYCGAEMEILKTRVIPRQNRPPIRPRGYEIM
jgi:hypothetical protein